MKFTWSLLLIFLWGCTQSNAQPEPAVENKFEPAPAIGLRYFTVTDTQRIDPHYGGQRTLNLQVWYPAATPPNVRVASAPYYPYFKLAYPHLEGWLPEDSALVAGVTTGSFLGLPLAYPEQQYPLVLLSPSLGGNVAWYTYYAEDLVRAGFVVAAVNHQYESEYVVLEDQRVIPTYQHFHDSLKALDIPAQITADEYRAAKGPRQKVLAEDLLFALDHLAEINEGEFNGQINLNKVGVWGHSLGGAAAVYAGFLDERIDAVLDLDGTAPSEVMEKGLSVPFAFIEDLTDYENHPGYAQMHNRRTAFCQQNTAGSTRILMAGTDHNSFLDINLHAAPNAADSSASAAILKQTSTYILDFFRAHLRDQPLTWLSQRSDSLEIIHFPPRPE